MCRAWRIARCLWATQYLVVYNYLQHCMQARQRACQTVLQSHAGGPNCTLALLYLWHWTNERSDWSDVSFDALDLLVGFPAKAGKPAGDPAPFSALLNYAFLAEQGCIAAALNAGWMLERGQGLPRGGYWRGVPGAPVATSSTGASTAVSTVGFDDRDDAPPRHVLQHAAYFYGRAARTNEGPALVDYANLLIDLHPYGTVDGSAPPGDATAAGAVLARSVGAAVPHVARLPSRVAYPTSPAATFQTIDGNLTPAQTVQRAVQLYAKGHVAGDVEATTNLAWASVAGIGVLQNLTRARSLYAAAVALAPDGAFADAFAPRAAHAIVSFLDTLQRILPAPLASGVRAYARRKARVGLSFPARAPVQRLVRALRQRSNALLRKLDRFGGTLNMQLGPPGVFGAPVATCWQDPASLQDHLLCTEAQADKQGTAHTAHRAHSSQAGHSTIAAMSAAPRQMPLSAALFMLPIAVVAAIVKHTGLQAQEQCGAAECEVDLHRSEDSRGANSAEQESGNVCAVCRACSIATWAASSLCRRQRHSAHVCCTAGLCSCVHSEQPGGCIVRPRLMQIWGLTRPSACWCA